ncbi:MAG TPA: kelch repeat-containing protein [Polyangiaceae bacterium]
MIRPGTLFSVAALLACSGGSPSAPHDVWEARSSAPVRRFESFAISDGTHIVFLGGITGVISDYSTAAPSREVDLYDPASDSWSPGPELPQDAPKHHLAVTVMDGRVYVLGGFDGILNQSPNEPFVPVAHAYVLDSGAWRRLADPPLARGAATAEAIGGKVYLTGGATTEDVAPFAELDIYDPVADAWSTGAPMPTAREHLASCAIGGKMIVVGGWVGAPGAPSVVVHAAESYDPATDAWTTLPDLPTGRGGLGALAVGSVCHVVGGEDWALPLPGTFHAHEGFDTASGTWTTFAPMPTARHGFGFASQGGALFAIGGGPSQGNSYSDVNERYLP